MMDNKKEYIICAAIHLNMPDDFPHQPINIENGLVVCGRRHHNCFAILFFTNITCEKKNITQGFLTSKDRFVDRKEAGDIAFKAGQISKVTDILMSEDIY